MVALPLREGDHACFASWSPLQGFQSQWKPIALSPERFFDLLLSVERFVRERLWPNEAKVAEVDAVPKALLEETWMTPLFGPSIPEDCAGLGLGMSEQIQAAFQPGQVSPAVRSLIGTNIGIGPQGILIDGTEEQKQRYLPELASGRMIDAFYLTKPESGSDAA